MEQSFHRTHFTLAALIVGLTVSVSADKFDRTSLPIIAPDRPLFSELDVRNVKEKPPLFKVTAPEGAPNIVIVLIDDLGFGSTSTFGGPIETPTLDKLASEGIAYNNFHTTSLCSPTRNALKTGRNHHTTNTGSIMESSTGFPGNTGQVPNSVAPVAEMLRLNGYSTGAFGKWHETAVWETSVSGPFDRWPTRQGFDKFYGFIGGETDQWYPLIYDGIKKVAPPEMENYHFTTDMTNQAINWVKAQQAMTPDKPFFMYFATGAMHAPHHAPQSWIDANKGKFDAGWDDVREKSVARQKKMGIIPENSVLPPKPKDIKDWKDLSGDEKKVFRKQAEVFAGFLQQTDYEIGRLMKAIEDIGEMDNTLIFFIAGDNGTSAEGGPVGMYNEMTYFNGVEEKIEDLIPLIDKWGGPDTFPHMASGWAVAFDAPFKWTKQVASDFGGTRNGLVIHWPNGIKEKGGMRTQFGHVIDVVPTILEATKIPEPKSVNGTPQIPIEGTSLFYTFNDKNAKNRHTQQYFELFGNRAMYKDSWLARTIHRAPWMAVNMPPLETDVWELYNVNEDFTLANNIADKHPKKLAELQELFMSDAKKYHVLPIDDRVIARMNPAIAGRPDIMNGRMSLDLYEGMDGMMENSFINVKNRSVNIKADVTIPEGGANGVILTQGGKFGGWSLYMKDGRPVYTYNFLGLDRYTVAGKEKIPAGDATIVMDFVYEGGGTGKGGIATISVNGKVVAEGKIEKTQPLVFSADETADVGLDNQTPVATDLGIGRKTTKFTGKINKIKISVKDVDNAKK